MNFATEPHHFRLETDSDGIVWLHMDKADAGTNVLGSEVLRELDRVITSYSIHYTKLYECRA